VKTTGFTQEGTVVIEFLRTFMVYRRGHVPKRAPMPAPKPKGQATPKGQTKAY
jgi:hypothetical protein